LYRALGSFACLIVEQAGAVILFLGDAWGLCAVGVGMMASFLFMMSGAWLLLVGVEVHDPRPVPTDQGVHAQRTVKEAEAL
jgi:hypothetical protein